METQPSTEEKNLNLRNLTRRKPTTQRANDTRFIGLLNDTDDATALDEVEHYHDRLQESVRNLMDLDDAIQDFLDDVEYDVDVQTCEEYMDKCKRAIRKARNFVEQWSSARDSNVTPPKSDALARFAIAPVIKLPTIKLKPFYGNIEEWRGF